MSQRFLLVSAASLALSLLLCSCHDRDECCEPCPRALPPRPQTACSEAPTPRLTAKEDHAKDDSAEMARQIAQLREELNAVREQKAKELQERGWFPSLLDYLRNSFNRPRTEPILLQFWRNAPRRELDAGILYVNPLLQNAPKAAPNRPRTSVEPYELRMLMFNGWNPPTKDSKILERKLKSPFDGITINFVQIQF